MKSLRDKSGYFNVLTYLGWIIPVFFISTNTYAQFGANELSAKDCAGSITICVDTIFQFLGGEGRNDFQSVNNEPNCLANGERNSAWFYIAFEENMPANSPFAFELTTINQSIADIDFAIFGPNLVCDSLGSPIRCSNYLAPGESTGLIPAAEDLFESDLFGDGYLRPLEVQPGEAYYILVNYFNNFGFGDEIRMTLSGAAVDFINCRAKANCQSLEIEVPESINICKGGIVPLNSAIQSDQPIETFSWTSPSGHLDLLEQPTTLTPVVNIPDGFLGTLQFELHATSGFCEKKELVEITVSPELNTPIIGDSLFCVNGANTLTAQFEYPNYLWSNGMTSRQIEVDQPGTYTLTVTDEEGCIGDSEIEVDWFDPPILNLPEDTFLCRGERVLLSAGEGFESYQWSSGSSLPFLFTNVPRTYGLTVTDQNGCTAVDTVILRSVSRPEPQIEGNNGICGNEQTTVRLNEPYVSYLWSNGSRASNITVNTPGLYSVTVTDELGCEGTNAFQLNVFDEPIAKILGDTVLCPGDPVRLTSQVTDETISWSNGANSPSITVEEPGLYELTVTNRFGCQSTDSISVNTYPIPILNWADSQTLCQGETIRLDAGNEFATVEWSNGSQDRAIEVTEPGVVQFLGTTQEGCQVTRRVEVLPSSLEPPQILGEPIFCDGDTVLLSINSTDFSTYQWSNGASTPTIAITDSGNFEVTVTDNQFCSTSASISVSTVQPERVTIAGPSILCGDTSLQLSVGTSFVQYQWSNGTENTTTTITQPGVYSIETEDVNGCVTSDEISIAQQPLPDITITGDTTFCLGGQTSLSTTPGYQNYRWSNGENTVLATITNPGRVSVIVTDSFGCQSETSVLVRQSPPEAPVIAGDTMVCPDGLSSLSIPDIYETITWSSGMTGAELGPVASGTYRVTVTDELGCTAESSINVVERRLMDWEVAGDLGFCAGASTELSISQNFETYQWSDGASGVVNVVSNPGDIEIMVIDQFGCAQSKRITVEEWAIPEFSLGENGYLCPGQTLELDGPVGGIQYEWSTGTNTRSLVVDQPGIYTLTLTDTNNCQFSDGIEVVAMEPIEPIFEGSFSFCPGTVDTVMVKNPYRSIRWQEQLIDSLLILEQPGQFRLELLDTLGCISNLEISVDTFMLDPINIYGDPSFCIDESAQVYVDPIFEQYLWSNGSMTPATSFSEPGIYSLRVTDANNCQQLKAVEIFQNELPEINIAGPTAFCQGDSITLSVERGMHIYLWSNNETTPSITINSPGQYIAQVMDSNACIQSDTIEVVMNALPAPLVEEHPKLCPNDTVMIGVSGFEYYEWENGAESAQIAVNTPGVYSVILGDENNCRNKIEFNVEYYQVEPIQILGDTMICRDSIGQIQLGGDFEMYQWSDGSTAAQFTVQKAGDYAITVVDDFNCIQEKQFSVDQVKLPAFKLFDTTFIDCNTDQVFLAFEQFPEEEPLKFEWSGPGISMENINLAMPAVSLSGSYVLQISELEFGCPAPIQSIFVNDKTTPPDLELVYSGVLDCQTTSITIDGSLSSQGPGIIYQWLDVNQIPLQQANLAKYTTEVEGIFYFQVWDSLRNCKAIERVDIEADYNYPMVDAGPSSAITCLDSTVQLDGSRSFTIRDVDYHWKTVEGQINSDPTFVRVQVDRPGWYYLEIKNRENGCVGIDSVMVRDRTNLEEVQVADSIYLNCYPEKSFLLVQVPEEEEMQFYYALSAQPDTIKAFQSEIEINQTGLQQLQLWNEQTGCQDSFDFEVFPPQNVPVVGDIRIRQPFCSENTNGEIELINVSGGLPPYLYSLQGIHFNSNPLFTQLEAGQYRLTVEGADGCQTFKEINLAYQIDSELIFREVPSIRMGDLLELRPIYSGDPAEISRLSWRKNGEAFCSDCLLITDTPLYNSKYDVQLVDVNGCRAAGGILVKVTRPYTVQAPNVFSPNGDGINDVFQIYLANDVLQVDYFQVFDRWGNLMHEQKDVDPQKDWIIWDGTNTTNKGQSSIYVYRLALTFIDGTQKEITGDVLLK